MIRSNNLKITQAIQAKSFLNFYFDHIYVVNLSHKVENRFTITKHLKSHGINFEIFEATNGYAGEALKKFQEYQKRPLGQLKKFHTFSEKEKKRGKAYIHSAGAMGYIYTYINILKDAKKHKYKRFLILEDDIILCKDFENKFQLFSKKIADNWKILLLGASQYGWNNINLKTTEKEGYYFPIFNDENDYTYGSFAIALDYSIVDELIELQSTFEAPFDYLPIGELYKKYKEKCYVAYPNLVIADVSNSNIRDGKCQLTYSENMKWTMTHFDYPLSKPSITIIITNKENIQDDFDLSDIKNLPFSLRLYFHSNDTLHPLHNIDYFHDFRTELSSPTSLYPNYLGSDYVTTIIGNTNLNKNIITKFIEYKLGLAQHNTTPIQDIHVNKAEMVINKVSIIIVLTKEPKYLNDTLASILIQDYSDIEVLIIIEENFEASIRNKISLSIAKYNNESSNCQLILIEQSLHNNISIARNKGILESSGEYVCFLDDGNTYLPGRLSKSISKLKLLDKNTSAVYCGYTDSNNVGNDSNNYQKGNLSIHTLIHAFKKNYLHINTITYRKDVLLAIMGFDESYSLYQTSDLHIRYFLNHTMDNIPETLIDLKENVSTEEYHSSQDLNIINSQIKFLQQYTSLIQASLASQDKQLQTCNQLNDIQTIYLKEQSIWIEKQKELQKKIKKLSSISFFMHPIKKIKSYKELLNLYYQS